MFAKRDGLLKEIAQFSCVCRLQTSNAHSTVIEFLVVSAKEATN